MLKKVKFTDYQVLRLLHNVTIIEANDTEALILITKRR